ncbi:CPBP family intramembrane glutamic endopeptidase [Cyanobium sp. WAJ14-Wanaka]|uniref:CPBP family intramembrane glutamic endopeptidase n=1 Tax=Cyanobium sp. WAJ14-Wanaka TaxID=2823725 RepID=UPI0020CC488F|nr:type II CAAX endopeptidase family protein [Cyanobium sp. WAJ14-Wanaka]MCP9774755.1 CPBP family intramembrane metalloprotease [Cyanobium sp. WAJ14-Wanaka]
MSASHPKPTRATPAWKWLLALLSLVLSALLWVSGLIESLQRPSVGNALSLRQLELAVEAAPAMAGPFQGLLSGPTPAESLRQELAQQIEAEATPPTAAQALELALLEIQTGKTSQGQKRLLDLQSQVPPEQRPLLQQLAGKGTGGDRWAWNLSPFQGQLVCAQLGSEPPCPGAATPASARRALVRLLGISAAPVLLLLLGLSLLVRQAWRRWRGGKQQAPALLGPPLDLLDATLLIAGGFVVCGELLTPIFLAPLIQAALGSSGLGSAANPGAPASALVQAITVLAMYGGLMSAPLLILWGQLRHRGPVPEGGWLQWGWRPLRTAGLGAVGQMLMVLPLVSGVGWLMDRWGGINSGSNPLLELVLNADQPLALGLFAFTATVLAPLFEETLFRGVLLPVVGQRYGGGIGVLVSALAFGLAHLSLGELPALFVLGLGLGWLRLQSGRLAPSVLMHGLWNGLTFANLLLLAG